MISGRVCFAWTALGAVLAIVSITAFYLGEMRTAYARVSIGSDKTSTPFGTIEYAQGGVGPPVLVVHGSGGGFDQGTLIANAVLGDNFHWIAPSRFGYLRSALPEKASWEKQAQAYALLLDKIGISEVSVVALSHGGPSALAFTALYPDRVSSLTLISCGVAPSNIQEQNQADVQGNVLTWLYQHDFPYWVITKIFKKQFLRLMGATYPVIADLGTDQLKIIEQIVDFMNPASLRSKGVISDNATPLTGYDIGSITAPTLIFHAIDDTLQLFHNAQFAAARITGAKLYRFEKGGHLLLGVEQSFIKETTNNSIGMNSTQAVAM